LCRSSGSHSIRCLDVLLLISQESYLLARHLTSTPALARVCLLPRANGNPHVYR
jgi:hypothetical protein